MQMQIIHINFPRNNFHLVKRILIGYRWRRELKERRLARSALELTQVETGKYIFAGRAIRGSFTISTNQITFKDSRSYREKRFTDTSGEFAEKNEGECDRGG